MEERFKAATKKKLWKCSLNAGCRRQKSPAMNIAVVLRVGEKENAGTKPSLQGNSVLF